MTLQTRDLWMMTLGVHNDSPPSTLQPPLPDGMHTRWSFDTAKGFPWYGYYLFRRPAIRKERGRACLRRPLSQYKPGLVGAGQVALGFGELSSDEPFVFTDDFPASGVVEVDLDGRSYVRYTATTAAPVSWVEATIGFRKTGRSGRERTCVDFRREPGGAVENPLYLEDARFAAFDARGDLQPDGRIVTMNGNIGWDAGFHAEVALPCPSNWVQVVLAHGGPTSKVIAFDTDGKVVGSAADSGAGPETLTLTGSGIVSVVIESPQDETIVLRLCWSCQGEREGDGDTTAIPVEARFGGILVASDTAVAHPGDIVTVRLTADSVDQVDVGPGPAALIDLCVVTVREAARSRGAPWETLDNFDYPLCLPVANGDYPCPNAPATRGGAEALALNRVVYGPPSDWAGAPFNSVHERLDRLVVGGPPPGGDPMAARSEPVLGSPTPPPEVGGAITQQRQRPLELLLLGSLQPAIAQMLGLYWWDKSAVPGEHYDYLLIADHDGSLGGSAATALDWIENVWNFAVNDGFVAFDRVVGAAAPLDPPTDLRAFALPGATVAPDSGGAPLDATNNAGLTWDRKFTSGVLLPDAPVMYHVWRADLGDTDVPGTPADADFDPLTKSSPLPVGTSIISPPQTPQQPVDWPQFPLHYIDRGRPDGWYAYRVNGVDIFGRHSAHSASADWLQWSPMPVPRPWYYVGPPSDTVVEAGHIRLLDKLAPPPPAGVEAFALDPADPTVQHDAAWQAWRTSLSQTEKETVVGLRVRWRWDVAQQRQAPDTREFRVYYEPAPLNAVRGRVTSTAPAGATQTDVVTDIPNSAAANAFVGLSARVGAQSFKIVSSGAGSPLNFRVKNIGPTDNIRPPERTRVSIELPASLSEDFSSAQSWGERMLVVGLGEHVQIDGAGNLQYEVLLPVAGSSHRAGLPLVTTLAEPTSAGVVGVTASDDKVHTPDHRGDAQRFGNESRIGGPATVFRVRREKPAPPPVPPDSAKVWASMADYHGNSFYTYRWIPSPHLKTFVYRALDDGVFHADSAARPRPALQATDPTYFPDPTVEPAWNQLKRQQIAAELNTLNGLDHGNKAAVSAAYRALSNDGLRVLAALPGTEKAFVQLTPLPLDPDEPDGGAPDGLRWRRVGPDVEVTALSPGQRAYVDPLDGKARNRYFYRSAYVDEVQNIGPLGLSGPPVWLPDVTAPVPPRVSKVASGERSITLEWTSNRESDLAEYRVYRTFDEPSARDIRLMDLVHSVAVAPGPPSMRPKTVGWVDDPVPGLRDIWYRLVAVDRIDPDPKGGGGNVSTPSPAMRARAFDETPPEPPAFTLVEWVRVDESEVVHPWTDPVPTGQTWVPSVRLTWPTAAEMR
ncbi:MAG: hypothetical protein ABI053_03745, partial [Lacisediminihabitans sp.]